MTSSLFKFVVSKDYDVFVELLSKASVQSFEGRLGKRKLSFLDKIGLFEASHIGGKLARELEAADMISLFEASIIGGKLARELKAADMNSLQAVIY